MKKSERKRLPSVDYRGAIKSMDEAQLDKFCEALKIPDQSHYKLLGNRKNKIADIVAGGYYVFRNDGSKFDGFDDAVWNALRAVLGDYKTVDYMFYNLDLSGL